MDRIQSIGLKPRTARLLFLLSTVRTVTATITETGYPIMTNSRKTQFEKHAVGGKKEAILEIASDLFLERGYDRASINEMYRRSGISKETFYRYFRDKEDLFLAVIDKELEIYWQGLSILDEVDGEHDIRETLTRVGSELIHYLSSDRVRALRQLIFSECENHPRIGQLYYNHGPQRAYQALASFFENQAGRGHRWRFDSYELAEYFVAMLLHRITLEQSCLIGKSRSQATIDKLAEHTASRFIDAFMLH